MCGPRKTESACLWPVLSHRVKQKQFEFNPRLFLLGSSVEEEGRALSTLLDWICKADDLTDSRVPLAC